MGYRAKHCFDIKYTLEGAQTTRRAAQFSAVCRSQIKDWKKESTAQLETANSADLLWFKMTDSNAMKILTPTHPLPPPSLRPERKIDNRTHKVLHASLSSFRTERPFAWLSYALIIEQLWRHARSLLARRWNALLCDQPVVYGRPFRSSL